MRFLMALEVVFNSRTHHNSNYMFLVIIENGINKNMSKTG